MTPARVRVGRVLAFLFLTFALSWAFMLGPWGDGPFPVGMLMPAAVATGLSAFFIEESGLHRLTRPRGPGVIVRSFWALVAIEVVLSTVGGSAGLEEGWLRSLSNWLMILWMLWVIRTFRRHDQGEFVRAGLQIGSTGVGMRLAAAVLAFLLLQPALELLLGVASFVGEPGQIGGVAVPAPLYPVVLLVTVLLATVGTPLGSMALLFGEEYGWRGFLLSELEPLGRVKATLIIGTVWAVWHTPVILSGIHTYAPTPGGFALAWLFFTLWSFVQTYVVARTGSIWAAAFIHGVVNGVYGLTRTLVRPDDKVLSFGLGVYGLLCLAVVVAWLLRDPLWREGSARKDDRATQEGVE
jgi:membrane protease YdiL (CAAX protease family)